MSTVIFILPFLLVYTVMATYAERKVAAFIQDRMGPMEVGYYGLAQSIADLVKLLHKEDIVTHKADRLIFRVAPVVIFTTVFAGFAVIPLSSGWSGANITEGLFYLLAIVSLDVIGIVMAGWGSHNKYSMLGTMRAAAQLVSYEVPLGLSVICVCMVTQSLDLQEISIQQSTLSSEPAYLLGIRATGIDTREWGGVFVWNVLRMPLLFLAWLIFFVASLAESNRAPFDLPEAESEIVAGFQTEYSGFRWAVIMLAEYGMMLLVSILGVVLFFGSWSSPLPNIGALRLADWTNGAPGSAAAIGWGMFWLLSKALVFVVVQMWVRWTFPRLRVDQLMSLSWKYLTPISLFLIMAIGTWKLIFG